MKIQEQHINCSRCLCNCHIGIEQSTRRATTIKTWSAQRFCRQFTGYNACSKRFTVLYGFFHLNIFNLPTPNPCTPHAAIGCQSIFKTSNRTKLYACKQSPFSRTLHAVRIYCRLSIVPLHSCYVYWCETIWTVVDNSWKHCFRFHW